MDGDAQARLERLVGPAALAYYDSLPEQLDTDGLLTDYGGEVRLVAADVLEYACTSKRAAMTASAGQALKSFRVEGEYAEEYFAPTQTPDSVNADAWCARAAQLRGEVRNVRRGSTSVRVEVGW